MEQSMDRDGADRALVPDTPVSDHVVPIELDQKPRGYQIELFEESLKRNIIVSMPTGSGKTLIAAMRARETLENCSNGQFVWFCAPKVQLAIQQHKVLSTQIPMFKSRLLTGLDNCEFWSQDVWDEILKDTSVVVSTYAILLDALKHAYLTLDRVALLIFDEAHHAVKSHPASQIMQLFYHCMAHAQRPSVLGMTATPVNKLGHLGALERNLDSVCRTPEIFEVELQRHVHVPSLLKLPYSSKDIHMSIPRTLVDLQNVVRSLKVEEDPWVRRTKQNPKGDDQYALNKVLVSGNTSLLRKANVIFTELGTLASKIYVNRCIQNYIDNRTIKSSIFDDMNDEEQSYLRHKLNLISLPLDDDLACHPDSEIRPKLQALLDFLAGEDPDGFTGLVFVKTRVEVALLSHILTIHPFTCKFRVSTFVGSSSFVGRKHELHELVHTKSQQHTLDELRAGIINLIITTDALEEGIDVVSCNVVICFEKPSNIRSYIQRRGRARNPTSRYIILQPDDIADDHQASAWRSMENTMKELFWDEERQAQNFEEIAEQDGRLLRHESSGAQLSPADTVAHLHHFCNSLSVDPYVDPSPVYTYEVIPNGTKQLLRASVRLPNIITDHNLRRFCGKSFWSSEKAARHDAAFEAYCGLFKAGTLLDEHLLPRPVIDPEVEAALRSVEIRSNVASVKEQIDIWRETSHRWSEDRSACHMSKVRMRVDGAEPLEMLCIFPGLVPRVDQLSLYWDYETKYVLDVEPSSPISLSSDMAHMFSEISHMLYSLSFSNKMIPDRKDLLAQFVPAISDLSYGVWLERHRGAKSALSDREHRPSLVRDTSRNGLPFIMKNLRYATKAEILALQVDMVDETTTLTRHREPHVVRQMVEVSSRKSIEADDQLVVLEVNSLQKRLDFLRAQSAPRDEPALHWLLAEYMEVEKTPLPVVFFTLFIPCLLYWIELELIVENLRSSLFQSLPDIDARLVREAILASSASLDTNYQRLEFLGDSILKFTTSFMLMISHLHRPEHILSQMKDHIVSNARLCRAAVDTGLDKYIVTRPFVSRKWRPLYRSDFSAKVIDKRRELSTKILADVVEALIGASHLSGGHALSLSCIRLFLPQENWDAVPDAFIILEDLYKDRFQSETVLRLIENVSGHKFQQGSLAVEAITHDSYQGLETANPYERLEFLGDAVLDIIVTKAAYHRTPPLPVRTLHLIRSALVNGHFLGFLCLTYSVKVKRPRVLTDDPERIAVVKSEEDVFVWQLLRHASPRIRFVLDKTLERLKSLRGAINEALAITQRHPWTLLAQLNPPKPLSDIIESILGAIYIDSKGDLGKCEKFLHRIGVVPYLQRVLNSRVALLHPKEELGQLANQEDVHYQMSQEGEKDKQRLFCTIYIGERELVKDVDGLTPMHTQTKAADLACQILRAEMMDVESDKASPESNDEANESSDVEGKGEMVSEDEDSEQGGVLLPFDVTENMMNEKRKRAMLASSTTADDSDEYMTAGE